VRQIDPAANEPAKESDTIPYLSILLAHEMLSLMYL
jgi:hypothetical protein